MWKRVETPTTLRHGHGHRQGVKTMDFLLNQACMKCRVGKTQSMYCDKCIVRFNTGGFRDRDESRVLKSKKQKGKRANPDYFFGRRRKVINFDI